MRDWPIYVGLALSTLVGAGVGFLLDGSEGAWTCGLCCLAWYSMGLIMASARSLLEDVWNN